MLHRLRHPAVWLPVSVGLLAFVVWRTRLWEAGAEIGALDGRLLLAALVVGQATPVLWALRSRALLAAAGRPVAARSLLPMTSFANTVNNLTPGSGGEVIRLYLLRLYHGVDLRTGAAVILIERFVALGYLAASALLLWLAATWHWPGIVTAGLVTLVVVAPGVVYRLGLRPLGILARLPAERVLGRERWTRWGSALRDVDGTIDGLLTRLVPLLAFAGATATIFTISTAQVLLVAAATGVSLDPKAAWGALGLSTVAGILSFLPFGLGATDLVFVGLLGAAGVPAVPAALVALGLRLVGTLPYALEGVAAYAWLSARLPAGGPGLGARAAAAALDAEPRDGAA